MNQNPVREMTAGERMRRRLFRWLFAAEYQQLQLAEWRLRICAETAVNGRGLHPVPREVRSREISVVQDLRDRADELERRLLPKQTRIKVAGGLQREEIAELLAGHSGVPAIRAVEALLTNKMVELSDQATDAPHGAYQTAEGVVPAFGHDERLHFAGGANATAELLADLQELVKAKEKPKPVVP